jgi:SAM-dependent methyltransferase
MDDLIKHYNKFNEDKRLLRRHGQVEFITSMKYIHDYLNLIKEALNAESNQSVKIIDIGAGTGRYSAALCDEGYDVTAVEYVPANLAKIKQKGKDIKAFRGDARNLKKFMSDEYDLTILFGPLYHLYTKEDKLLALSEAKRVTKPGGFIMVGYLLNDYAVLTYGIKEGHLLECLSDGRLNSDFHTVSQPKDLYEYVRLEEIEELNELAGLKSVKLFTPDGPTDFLRREINAMDDEAFNKYIEYLFTICERGDLLGAGSHVVDVVRGI